MSDWAKCLKSRAALSIYLSQEKECPHPYDCRFWDGLRERCAIRLVSDTLAVELVLNRLNRLGWPDKRVAEELGVTPSSVSRWRSGKAPVPEERMPQLHELLARLETEDAGRDKHIMEDGSVSKSEKVTYVRRLLNFLNSHGYNDSRVAWYLGLARSSVSNWRSGRNLPRKEDLFELEKLRDELSGE